MPDAKQDAWTDTATPAAAKLNIDSRRVTRLTAFRPPTTSRGPHAPMKSTRLFIASVSLLFLTAALRAQTWDGDSVAGGNLDWGTGANWSGNTAPVNNGTANVVFGGTIDNNPGPNLDQNWSISSLTFNNTAGAFTLGSTGAFTLTILGGGITNADTQTQTINHALALNALQMWSAQSGALTIGGSVSLGANTLTFNAATGTSTISGAISGTGGLLKIGNETLTLGGAGNNTYGGATTVNAGTLNLNKISASAITGPLEIGDGDGTDTVALLASNQISDAAPVTVNSSGIFNLGGFTEGLLALTVNGGSVNIGTGVLNIGTSINMTRGSISSTGAGQLVLSGNLTSNAATSSATISGTLSLGAAIRNLTVADNLGTANDLDISATVVSGGLNKLGAGTLRLSGTNSFGSGLTVTAGTVALGSNTAAGTGSLTFNGGTVVADGAARTLSNALFINNDFTVGGAQALTLSGNGTLSGNRTLTVSNSATTTFSGALGGGTNALTKAGAGTLFFSGATANTYTGTTTVNEGTLTLAKTAGINAIAGDIVVGTGGNVSVNANNQIADSSDVTVNSNSSFNLNGFSERIAEFDVAGTVGLGAGTLTVNSVELIGNSDVSSLGGSLVLLGNATTVASGSFQSIFGTAIDLSGTTRLFTIGDGAGTFEARISGPVSNGTLVKVGAGGLLLTASSSGSANVALNDGLLGVALSNSIGNGTLTLNNGTIQGQSQALSFANPVTIRGDVNLTFAGTQAMTFTGPITLDASAPTLAFSNSADTTFAGAIGQSVASAAPTKSGPGVLIFSGAGSNTYSGITSVLEGSLRLSKTGGATAIPGNLVIGDGTGSDSVQLLASDQIGNFSSVTVNSGALFDVLNAFDFIGALVVNNSGTVSIGSSGTLVVQGGLQMTEGAISSGGGRLVLSSNLITTAASGSSTIGTRIDLNGPTRTFTIANGTAANDLDISSEIALGSIVKDGVGTLRFSGTSANIYTGTTTVNDGTLVLAKTAGVTAVAGPLVIGDGLDGETVRLDAANQIANTSSVTTNGFAELNLNGFSETIGALTMNGGIVNTGAGTLTLGGSVTSGVYPLAGPPEINGNLNLGGATRTFNVFDDPASLNDFSLNAVVGNGGLIKSGAGGLLLSGNNTFVGGLFINSGTVLLGNNTAAGSGTVTLNGATLMADSGARTLANNVVISGAGAIDGAQNLTLNGGFFLEEGASLVKNGSGILTLGTGSSSLEGALTLNTGTFAFTGTKSIATSGSFTQNAGTTFNGGTLINRGQFIFNGGAFNGTLQNEGVFAINSYFNAQSGFTNLSTVVVSTLGNLSAGGTGIVNEGTLTLTGGTLQSGGTGPVVNNGEITGFGSIFGSAGFTNNALVTVSGGNLTLGNGGASTNAGNIDVTAGRQFRLSSALGNTGTISLAGGTIGSFALLSNNAGGTVAGRGAITTSFVNAGGTLRAEGGTLNVTNAFNSSGLIRVEDGAGLAGGAITNTGRIQGDGSIANPITNNGRIEPVGTLALGGPMTQNAAGTIAAAIGNTVVFTSGLAANAGTISLSGGTFDNNGFALNNTGQISGFGTFSTGGLTNNGSVTLTGGFTTVNGNVTNAAGQQFRVAHNAALFTGNFTNNGTFKNTDATITFAGTYTENGIFNSDPADNFFSDLIVGESGALQGGVGDRFFVSGDLLSASTQNLLWDTRGAELRFSGGDAGHAFVIGGADLGLTTLGFENNFAWGVLSLVAGETLTLDGGAEHALYVGVLDLGGGTEQFASIETDGTNIYYDQNRPENSYLGGQTFALNGGGLAAPVPEPASIVMFALGGLGLLLALRRRLP